MRHLASKKEINAISSSKQQIMATQIRWESLPSVIFVDILSYLSMTDRIKVTSVCKRWRSLLFHPFLWRSVAFSVTDGKRERAKFITDKCARFVREVSLEFGTRCFGDVLESIKILKILSENCNLEKLTLRPSSCQVLWPERGASEYINRLHRAVYDTIKHARNLKHLSLGCVGELTDHCDVIVSLLAEHQLRSLQSLHISSVKENPESYGLVYLPQHALHSFSKLTVLGIDYDYINNSLLQGFVHHSKTTLCSLILHVHGIDHEQEKITNDTWNLLISANPSFQVTLNLIHSVDGAENLLDILQPAMPLTHYRQFFCETVNTAAFSFVAQHVASRLKSLVIVEGFDEGVYPIPYEPDGEQDMFVMLAWKAANLRHFTLIGYEYCVEDLVAITRLRGRSLQTLDIPSCCLREVVSGEDGNDEMVTLNQIDAEDTRAFINEISHNLDRDWKPLANHELHPSILDCGEDAEAVYLSILQSDQL